MTGEPEARTDPTEGDLMYDAAVRLPRTSLDVSPICLGTGGFGSEVEAGTCFRLLDRFAELGGNFFDSAHCYDFWMPEGLGMPERVLGQWVRQTGAKVVVATKGGHPEVAPGYPRPDDFLSPDLVSQDISDSLERLGMETIDLYYLHRDDGRTPVAEIVDALNDEVNRGRLSEIGASNWSVERIAEANAYASSNGKKGFVVSQPQWSLATPSWTAGEDPTVRHVIDTEVDGYTSLGIAVIPYSSTANGFFGSNGERGAAFQTEENRKRLARATKLAEEIDATPNQVALAWLMNQGLPVVPIIGTRNEKHLEDAIGAAAIALTTDQVRWLRRG